MRRGIRGGSLGLDPEGVAWHQLHSFVARPRTFAERLAESPLFRGSTARRWGIAEWIRPDEEADPVSFPLGRVVTHAGGILLEAFSEERLDDLRRRVRAFHAGDVPADETRVFRLETVLANPGALLQPLHERAGRSIDARAIARIWLRMAWPFLARPDLGGRAPYSLATSARGRDALEAILPRLRAELATIAGFPRVSVRTLRSILLPSQTIGVAPSRKRGALGPRSRS